METRCACKGAFLERFIQPSILLILNGGPEHGFSILKKLYKSELMDYSSLDPAGFYRMLKKMEESGLLVSEIEHSSSGADKRVFSITYEGRVCLIFWKNTLMDYMSKISRLADAIPDFIDEEDK